MLRSPRRADARRKTTWKRRPDVTVEGVFADSRRRLVGGLHLFCKEGSRPGGSAAWTRLFRGNGGCRLEPLGRGTRFAKPPLRPSRPDGRPPASQKRQSARRPSPANGTLTSPRAIPTPCIKNGKIPARISGFGRTLPGLAEPMTALAQSDSGLARKRASEPRNREIPSQTRRQVCQSRREIAKPGK